MPYMPLGTTSCTCLQELIATKSSFISSHFPFLRWEEILRAMLPSSVSHTSIHRLVGKVIDPYLEAEEKQIEEVYDAGVIPESEVRWSV